MRGVCKVSMYACVDIATMGKKRAQIAMWIKRFHWDHAWEIQSSHMCG